MGCTPDSKGNPVPAVIATEEKPVKAVVAELTGQGAVLVIIDTPPLVTPQLNAALEAATGIVLVTRPNPMDLDALLETWAIVQRLRKSAAAVIMQAPPAAQRTRAMTYKTEAALRRQGSRPAQTHSPTRSATHMHRPRHWPFKSANRRPGRGQNLPKPGVG